MKLICKILPAASIILFSFHGYGQTTPLTFTQLSTTPDLIANDRGAEGWNGRVWDNGSGGAIKVPIGNVTRRNDYYRFLWRTDIAEVTQGTYSWTTFDTQIQRAIDSGRTFSFALMALCDACGVNPSYPDYLHTLMQGEATNSKDWQDANGDWIPNWNSPNYLARYKALLMAVANHIATTTYKGVPYANVIGYVDVRGYGDFGEWQTYPWTGTEPTGRAATAASLDSLIDFNRQAFPNFWNVNLQGVFDPSNSSQMPTAVTNYALAEKNNVGLFGWRRDQWGDPGDSVVLDKNPHGHPITDSIMNRYKEAPIVGEPQLTSSTYNCGSILCDLPREMTFYHGTSFGNGNYASDGDAGTQANVIQASANSGYRLVITSGSITTSIYRNFPFAVTLNWQNLGVAPVYYPYTVTYILKNSGGTTVWTGNSSFNPTFFLPSGSPTGITDNLRMGNVTPGTGYNLYIKFSDPVGYEQPLQLAITGRQSDGSYLVQSGVTILNRNILIVIWGESNAAGMADNSQALSSEILPRSEVQIYNHSTKVLETLKFGSGGNNQQNTFADTPNVEHGMELGMANEVDSNILPNPTYLCKIGISGGVICQWFTGGCVKVGDSPPPFQAWDDYMPYVDSAIKRMTALGVPFDIVVWGSMGLNNRYNQGTPAGHFYDSMKLFISNFRTRVGQPNAQFYLTNFNNPPAQTYDWKYLFDSLAKTDPYTHSIPVIGTTYKDGGTHYDYQGFKLIVHNIVDTMQGVPPSSGVFSNFDIGSGSGTLTLTSQSGHNRGDTANIVSGSYSGGTISNLFGIYIRPKNAGSVTFTGTLNMFADSGCSLDGSLGDTILFSHIAGVAINNNTSTVGQGWVDMDLGYLKFIGGSGDCIDGSGNMRYVQGNNASYHWLRVHIHNTYQDSTQHFIQGSFGNTGDPSNPPDWERQLQWDHWVSHAQQATGNGSNRGLEYLGICTNCSFHDFIQTMDNTEGPEGDVGVIRINGWARCYNGYKNGGPAYIFRSDGPIQEDTDPGRDTCYNLIKVNSTGYGVVAVQFDTSQSVSGKWHGTGGSFYNLTIGNDVECCGYWAPVVNNGNEPPYENYFCGNVVAINNQTNLKNKTYVDLGGSPGWFKISTDTLTQTQQAYASFAAAGYDTTTVYITNVTASYPKYLPLIGSPVRNQGQNLGTLFSTDIYGTPRSVLPGNTWDPGATQFPGIKICNCFPRPQGTKTRIH